MEMVMEVFIIQLIEILSMDLMELFLEMFDLCVKGRRRKWDWV
jgi:hypothetical protein